MVVLVDHVVWHLGFLELRLELSVLFLQGFQIPSGVKVLVDFSLDLELILLYGIIELFYFYILDALDVLKLSVSFL